jgi:hypothetical protein
MIPIRGIAPVAVMALLVVASAADARSAGPVVSWSVPTQVTANSNVSIPWSATRVPRGGRLEVQGQVGTGRVWKRLVRLSGSRGTATLSGRPLGQYRIRLVVAAPRGQILAMRSATLEVFGEVPLGELLGASAQTYTTSSFSFSYVGRAQADKFDRQGTAWTVSAGRNHCRSVHLTFPVGDSGGTTTEQLAGTVSLVQEAMAPATVAVSSIPPNVYSLDALLTPGQSWSVNLTSLSPEGGTSLILYAFFNGVASCDSTEVAI